MKRIDHLVAFFLVWRVLFSVSGEMNADIMFEFLSKRIDNLLFEARSLQVKVDKLEERQKTFDENVQRQTTAIEQLTKRSLPNYESVEKNKETVELQALALWKTMTNEKTILRESIKQFDTKLEELRENMKKQMHGFFETVTKDLLSANSSIKATSKEIMSLHDDVHKTEKYIQNLSLNFISESKHLRVDLENIESILKLEIEQMNIKLQTSIANAKARDGGWTGWAAWEQCSATCGIGLQRRERTCTSPEPKSGGRYCVGEPSAYQMCSATECNPGVDGGWSAWSRWETCSVTCGTGLQSRKRSCNNPKPHAHGRHCEGDFTDYQLCFVKECPGPIDGGWSTWTAWDQCTNSCGVGTQSRKRTCTSPAPSFGGNDCTGKSLDYQMCNTGDCTGMCIQPVEKSIRARFLVQNTCDSEKANYAVLVKIEHVWVEDQINLAQGSVVKSINRGIMPHDRGNLLIFYWKKTCPFPDLERNRQYYIIGKDGHEVRTDDYYRYMYELMGTALVIKLPDCGIMKRVMNAYERKMYSGCQN